MKKPPGSEQDPSFVSPINTSLIGSDARPLGMVLSGGGSRAAYQVGALKALQNFIDFKHYPISYLVGSSIGAINSLLMAATLKNGYDYAINELDSLWLERTFKNSFKGSPTATFFRSVKMAILKYARDPGPGATNDAIFNPEPLMNRINYTLNQHGGTGNLTRDPNLKAVGVMTTIEGKERKPLMFISAQNRVSPEMLQGASFEVCHVEELTANHGFASAALPSVLPPVSLDVDGGQVRFVDGGISQNVPVDPIVRMGAERVIVVDISGRSWWLDKYGESHDTRPDWEVPAALKTFCIRPPETFVLKNIKPFGPILKDAVGNSTRDFIQALGATWPVYTLIKKKLGVDLAYEVMSYVALHPEYAKALIELGYNETMEALKGKTRIDFKPMPIVDEHAAV
ncbi:MAG: patatin-like phospholipase family protein [bacterium]|nr:patatin-like phospholipase family protein [bacterium]